jgi:HlyD family secretion protein
MLKRLVVFGSIALALAAVLFVSQWSSAAFKVSGFVEADEIRIGSRVGGRVHRVHVQEGQVVKVGEVILELEPFDLHQRRAEAEAVLMQRQREYAKLAKGFREEERDQAKARRDELAAHLQMLVNGPREQEIKAARARLKLAVAELDLAESDYRRTEDLFGRAAVAKEELDDVTKQLRVARSNHEVREEELALLLEGTRREEIEQAKAQLEQAQQEWLLRQNGYRPEEVEEAKAAVDAANATLEAIKQQIDELTVTAPLDAVVEAVDLQPGDLVTANAPVLSLMDTSHLWVRAYVPENQLDIQVGQKVPVTVDSFPGQRFAGHISFIARQAEFTPNNVQTPEDRSKQVFRIKVELDEGLDRLRPGMAADVWFEGR